MERHNGYTGYTAFFQLPDAQSDSTHRYGCSPDCYPNYNIDLELVQQNRHVVFKLLAVSNQLFVMT